MQDRGRQRCRDIMNAINHINDLLKDRTLRDLTNDRHLLAAFERYLEILSEASRHVPDQLRQARPDVEWQNIANLGNHIRHAYHRVDAEILWNVYDTGKLAELSEACSRFIGSGEWVTACSHLCVAMCRAKAGDFA